MSDKRFYFLDNLRVIMTAFVIAQHVGLAYGPSGAFWPIQEAARTLLLKPFFLVNRSFGMSLFFMIAGYLAALACERHGPPAFVKARLLRLGLPLLGFTLVNIPIQLAMGGSAWPLEAAHMWFVEHLILYCAGYAAWQSVRARRGAGPGVVPTEPPAAWLIVAFALGLALVSGVVRCFSPIDHWDYILGFFRVAFADVPRDMSFFVIGTLVYHRGWLYRFSARAGYRWLAAGLILAALCYAYDLGLDRLFPLSATAHSVLYPIWESILCCALCIGLTVLCREKLNVRTRLTGALAQSQYATYFLHLGVVLPLQYAMLGVDLAPLLKFSLVTLAAVPLAFLAGSGARKPLGI